MSNNWDIELLQEIQAASAEDFDSWIDDFDGKKVLVMEHKGDVVCEDYNIIVEHYTEDTTAIAILFTLMSNLDSKQSADLAKLLPYLNKYLSLGSFALMEDDGFFYYNYSFIIDKESEREIIVNSIVNALTMAVFTSGAALTATFPVVNGETPVEDCMNDGISIIQF